MRVRERECKRRERCGEGELVGRVPALVVRSVQVYHELQDLEEEDEGRKVVQEIERESQVEEKHSHEMTMWMG